MANGQSHIHVECLNLKLSVVKRQGTSSHPDHFFFSTIKSWLKCVWNCNSCQGCKEFANQGSSFLSRSWLNTMKSPQYYRHALSCKWGSGLKYFKVKKMHLWWQLVRSLYLKLYNLFNNKKIIMIIWKIHYPRAGKIPTVPSGMLEEIISTTTRIHKYHNSQCNPARNHNLYLNSITKNAKVQMLIC